MSAFYGARFADAWRGVDVGEVKAVWAEELGAYTVAEIQRGIASLKERQFPPTLPEFLQICRPRPDYVTAHAEACRLIGRLDGWSDCSVFWAAREIGYHDLKQQRYRDIEGRWKDALDRAWLNRKPIPEPEPVAGQLSATAGPVAAPLTEEQRQEIRDRIRNFGRKMSAKPEPLRQEPSAEMEAALREIESRNAI